MPSLLKGLQALILIVHWTCTKLILDYAIIRKWPGSYSVRSSDHVFKTWIYLNYDELHSHIVYHEVVMNTSEESY